MIEHWDIGKAVQPEHAWKKDVKLIIIMKLIILIP